MFITLILSEFLVGRALQDLIIARKSYREIKSYAEADGVPWTMTHAYFANIGGFVFKIHILELQPSKPVEVSATKLPPALLTGKMLPSQQPQVTLASDAAKSGVASPPLDIHDSGDDKSNLATDDRIMVEKQFLRTVISRFPDGSQYDREKGKSNQDSSFRRAPDGHFEAFEDKTSNQSNPAMKDGTTVEQKLVGQSV
jgi:hypothetical protein